MAAIAALLPIIASQEKFKTAYYPYLDLRVPLLSMHLACSMNEARRNVNSLVLITRFVGNVNLPLRCIADQVVSKKRGATKN